MPRISGVGEVLPDQLVASLRPRRTAEALRWRPCRRVLRRRCTAAPAGCRGCLDRRHLLGIAPPGASMRPRRPAEDFLEFLWKLVGRRDYASMRPRRNAEDFEDASGVKQQVIRLQ